MDNSDAQPQRGYPEREVPEVRFRVGFFWVEHAALAAQTSWFIASGGGVHPQQGFHGVCAFVVGEGVDGPVELLGYGVVGETEPSDCSRQAGIRDLRPVLPPLAQPRDRRKQPVFVEPVSR
ncbi:hypothetical protein [Streptomyces anulatus]|uniref:hypothetical protein n=1 Tax=Streptomyces anulatus TaxID=1892 RepID=UPI0035E25333